MRKNSSRRLAQWLLFAFVLFLGLLCRELNTEARTPTESALLIILQLLIYTGLVAFWGVSVHRRIVKPQVRKLLELTSDLLLFWFLARAAKYYLLDILSISMDVAGIKRYLWYSYYIPMLFLPMLLLLTAFSLRQPESYQVPQRTMHLLHFVSVLFLVLVFTNDFHQLIFRFPEDAAVFSDDNYRYGLLYYACLLWIVGCCICALCIMIRKCRLPSSKTILWLPILPLLLCIGYAIAYITKHTAFFNDMILVYSFSLIAILETTITVGLIPSNSHYAQLFAASDLSALITDDSLTPVYASVTTRQIPRQQLEAAIQSGSVTQNGARLSVYPISGGYVFWQEDVHELMEIIGQLQGLNEDLEEKHAVLQEEYETRHKRQSLEEKNRLYNIMQCQTKDKIARLYALTDAFQKETDAARLELLTSEIAMIAAYLKRRNNLIFIAEETREIPASELYFCLKESLSSLTVRDSDLVFLLEGVLSFSDTTKLYDAFQTAVEAMFAQMEALFVVVMEEAAAIRMTLNVRTCMDLRDLPFTLEKEGDRDWTLEYTIRKGGTAHETASVQDCDSGIL